MTVKVGINGFGRIGRLFFRAIYKRSEFEVVAVNDIMDAKMLAHLLKYDSIHGRFPDTVEVKDDTIIVAGKSIKVLMVKEPEKLPWKAMGVDYVVESTGRFTDVEAAAAHITAGAKKVIISAPAKSKDKKVEVPTFVMGVNEEKYDPANHHIVSCASCTTNCLAPMAKVLQDRYKIKSGLMTTIHSYTQDQVLQDGPHKEDLRRARAANLSMIPTKTGAASAIGLVIPELKGKLDGVAIRVPTPNVSLTDLTVIVEKAPKDAKEVIAAYKEEAAKPRMKGILEASEEELVSRDFNSTTLSCIIDLPLTRVIGDQIKVFGWYDNEMGYSTRLGDLIAYMIKKSK